MSGNGCRHYWLVQLAKGETSTATCKFCGTQREFRNTLPPNFPVRTDPEMREARYEFLRNNRVQVWDEKIKMMRFGDV